MDTDSVDPIRAARALVEWIETPTIGPLGLGFALDLWLALTGKPLDPDDPEYEAGMQEAIALAYRLIEPEDPEPTVVVTTVEIVRGEVL